MRRDIESYIAIRNNKSACKLPLVVSWFVGKSIVDRNYCEGFRHYFQSVALAPLQMAPFRLTDFITMKFAGRVGWMN